MKGKSFNNTKQVQSDYLKRVERLCGLKVAEKVNDEINFYALFGELPPYVLKSHYRSLASNISKPSKYQNKIK